jgi:hypothetical protein
MPLARELHQEWQLVLDLESLELCRHRQKVEVLELGLESLWR